MKTTLKYINAAVLAITFGGWAFASAPSVNVSKEYGSFNFGYQEEFLTITFTNDGETVTGGDVWDDWYEMEMYDINFTPTETGGVLTCTVYWDVWGSPNGEPLTIHAYTDESNDYTSVYEANWN